MIFIHGCGMWVWHVPDLSFQKLATMSHPFCCSSWGDSIHQGGTIFTREYCPGGHYSRGDTIHSDTGNLLVLY